MNSILGPDFDFTFETRCQGEEGVDLSGEEKEEKEEEEEEKKEREEEEEFFGVDDGLTGSEKEDTTRK